jgi:glutamate-1-semialdehyde 2,1-aminomutase
MGVPYPINFVKGKGSKIWDADGNEYTDFCMAMGPNILGHGHPEIVKAVKEQLEKGLTMYVGTDELEIKVAEKIMQMCPRVSMVRFSNSGTEATLHAMRFARAHTGKEKIIKFEGHYHGWHDYGMISNLGVPALGPSYAPYAVPSTWGIPQDTMKTMIVLPWNDLEVVEKTIKRRAGEIAAVISEPVMMNIGCVPPKEGYLKGLQELCAENDVVFILDEIISGFRIAPGGAAEYYDLEPDLVTYGKALGAGFPVSAIAGKKQIMQDVVPGRIFHAGTYDANPVVMAACLASLGVLSANGYAAYKHLDKLARMLKAGLEDAIEKTNTHAIFQSVGAVGGQLYFTELEEITDYRDFISNVDPPPHKFPRYQMELMKRGIYAHPLQSEHEFISAVHTEEDMEKHISASTEALRAVA